jgi:hypothetical protein
VIRFRVRYSRPADLVADDEAQFAKGGLLLRVEPPSAMRLFEDAELELVTLAGSIVVPAQVVQLLPGIGVALSFDATQAALRAAVDEARGAGEMAGGPPEHSIVVSADASPARERPAPAAPASAAGGGSTAAKIHLAMYGGRDERMRILREGDRSLHRYVLRNPGLRIDEVTFIAKMTAVSADLLKAIAERPEWAQRPEVALALVRNPKSPVPLAIQMLQHVSPGDLRRLAKGSNVRMPILQAARKRVVG